MKARIHLTEYEIEILVQHLARMKTTASGEEFRALRRATGKIARARCQLADRGVQREQWRDLLSEKLQAGTCTVRQSTRAMWFRLRRDETTEEAWARFLTWEAAHGGTEELDRQGEARALSAWYGDGGY